ncbi:MAG: ParB/RepB/Spo0J family partition protein [Alphaproteobacteria bacterium]|tara:strand:- start:621 stop:1487 length:867 start_codon:yes stop_codon:yes gene_type:complete
MKKGLGKGLAALIGDLDEKSNDQGTKINTEVANDQTNVPIEFLVPNRDQPRKNFSETSLDELSQSIKQKGILLPILVRPLNDKEFQIIAGERRWRAAQKAGLNEVPVIIKNFNEIEVLEIGLIENMQRENLSAIEEALGFEKLQKEYNYTQENLSKILSKSRAYVANALRLLSLPHKVQQLVQSGDLSSGHARALIVLADPLPVAKFAIKKGMSVRQLESYVSYLKKDKKSKQASVSQKSPDTLMLEKKLTDNLGLSVQIDEGKGEKGEIKIKYLSYDQLNFICDKLN